MKRYLKVGRDIIVGSGFAAKHWSGAIVFSADAIYVSPNLRLESAANGDDSGTASAGFMMRLLFGVDVPISIPPSNPKPEWMSHLTDVMNLSEAVTKHADWPLKRKKRAVIIIQRADVATIKKVRGRIVVTAHGNTYRLGLKLFGRSNAVRAIREMGWDV